MLEPAAEIARRFGLHAISSGGAYLLVYAGLWLLDRFFREQFNRIVKIGMPALLVLTVAVLREPWDVSSGQSLVKAVFDFVSWGASLTFWAWLVYRIGKAWQGWFRQ